MIFLSAPHQSKSEKKVGRNRRDRGPRREKHGTFFHFLLDKSPDTTSCLLEEAENFDDAGAVDLVAESAYSSEVGQMASSGLICRVNAWGRTRKRGMRADIFGRDYWARGNALTATRGEQEGKT